MVTVTLGKFKESFRGQCDIPVFVGPDGAEIDIRGKLVHVPGDSLSIYEVVGTMLLDIDHETEPHLTVLNPRLPLEVGMKLEVRA